jgi:hypothetical protein
MSIISLNNVRDVTKKPAMWTERIFDTGWQDEQEGGRRVHANTCQQALAG